MRIKTTWEIEGEEGPLAQLATELTRIVEHDVAPFMGGIVVNFADERDPRATALQKNVSTLQERFPSLRWQVRRRAIYAREELDAFPLLAIHVPDGEPAVASSTLQGGDRCARCGASGEPRIATEEIHLLGQRIPASPILGIYQYTAVRKSTWAMLEGIAGSVVRLHRVFIDEHPAEDWVAVAANLNLGRMAGDVTRQPVCPQCGISRLVQNNNLIPTYHRGAWQGEPWVCAEDTPVILGSPALLQCIERIVSPAEVGAKPVHLIP